MFEQHTTHWHLLFLSGELMPENEETMAEHHADCSACRRDLQRLQVALQWYEKAVAPPPSPQVLIALRARARRQILQSWQWRLAQWLHLDWSRLRTTAITVTMILMAVWISRLPRQNATAMLEPFAPMTHIADVQISNLRQRMAILDQSASGSGSPKSDQNSSEALFDDELKNIRNRMNRLARDILAE
jgi:hypothetical protein